MLAAYPLAMPHDCLTEKLMSACREKVATRVGLLMSPSHDDHGLPMLLQQIFGTLRHQPLTPEREVATTVPAPGLTQIGRASALRNAELLRLGDSIDQIIHDYDHICQPVTELAVKRKEPTTADKFRTLDRCIELRVACKPIKKL
jgi:hypothetical protein